MITWGDVIDIITSAFEINQTTLGNKIGYNKSKISRIRSGQAPGFTNEQLFSAVFDPADLKDTKQKKQESNHRLDLLKDIIKSDFEEVYKSLSDCWDEKNYETFVLTLLGRAKRGVPTKDCHKKQEKVPLSETPSEKMSKIFEQAVVDYNIATYICKLPDYLLGEVFYSSDIYDFIDTIQTDILGKFVNKQDENIFKRISEFTLALKTYSGCLGMIQLSESEKYGTMLKICGYDIEIICLIDSDCDEVKYNLDKEKEVSIERGETNSLLVSELEGKINQLEFLRSVLLSHKQLCELYEEIYPGKALLIFQ